MIHVSAIGSTNRVVCGPMDQNLSFSGSDDNPAIVQIDGRPHYRFSDRILPVVSGGDGPVGGGDPAGGAGGGDPAGGGADPAGGANPAGGGDPAGGANGGGENVDSLPEWAQKALSEARGEAAKYRNERNDTRTAADEAKKAAEARDEQLKLIAKALGLTQDEPTVDDLQKQLEQRDSTEAEKDATIRSLQTEIAFRDVAQTHDADAELTLAVLEKRGALKGLDPAAEDFTKTLDALVKDAVEKNPRLKVTQVAPKGGSKFGGNASGGGPTPSKGLAGAIDAAINS